MKIEQINIGKPTAMLVGGRECKSGIYKEAVAIAVDIDERGLAGDAICNTRHHGGPDQAVYLYGIEDYAFWAQELGKDVPAGTFGENLTTSGVDLSDICVGDVLMTNRLTLQVTAPRIPCNTLATRMGEPEFVRQFIGAGRSGAYCRVLEAGQVSTGDQLTHIYFEGDRIPLVTFFRDAYRKLDSEALQRYLAAPIDERTRAKFTKQLAAVK